MKQLLIFTATWCSGCQQYKKTYQDMQIPVDNFRVFDVDASPEKAAAYGIRSIPMTVLLLDGQEVNRKNGSMTEKQLLEFCNTVDP